MKDIYIIDFSGEIVFYLGTPVLKNSHSVKYIFLIKFAWREKYIYIIDYSGETVLYLGTPY